MCDVLGVSAGGFYDAVRAAADERLRVEVRAAHCKSKGRYYGAPRLVRELRDAGTRARQRRFARLMRADRLAARRAGSKEHACHSACSRHVSAAEVMRSGT